MYFWALLYITIKFIQVCTPHPCWKPTLYPFNSICLTFLHLLFSKSWSSLLGKALPWRLMHIPKIFSLLIFEHDSINASQPNDQGTFDKNSRSLQDSASVSSTRFVIVMFPNGSAMRDRFGNDLAKTVREASVKLDDAPKYSRWRFEQRLDRRMMDLSVTSLASIKSNSMRRGHDSAIL